MAEAFLEEIYKKSIIVEYLKEAVEFTQKNLLSFAIRTWSEKILPAIEKMPPNESIELPLKEMLKATEAMRNPSLFISLMEDEILPKFYSYFDAVANIDVDENGFRLKSTKTGFLTLSNEITGQYYHCFSDPMWEAHVLAKDIFDPQISEYVIWGSVGLGYLPYQIYTLSHESVKITLLGADKQSEDYGKKYGVLGWISEKDLNIVNGNDEEMLELLYKTTSSEFIRGIIMPHCTEECINMYGGHVKPYLINCNASDKYAELYGINYRKNMELRLISAEELVLSKSKDEWVVVAAGPSLDDEIEYIRNNTDSKNIISVNTVARKLIKNGIKPDIIVAIDAHDQLEEHIIGVENEVQNIPLLMHPLTNWKFVHRYTGPKFCFKTDEMTNISQDDKYPLWTGFGVTVSSVAMEAAYRYGAKTIRLIGLDLGYPGGRTFAEGAAHINTSMDYAGMMVEAVDGGKVRTTTTFLQFKKGIEYQIKRHPEVKVYNMSKHGAFIRGCDVEETSNECH